MGRRQTRHLILGASLLWSCSCLTPRADQPADRVTPSFPKLAAIRDEAEAGNLKAQAKLGDYYFSVSDFTNAVIWYRKAAEQGETEAQFSLASCYLAGRGVAKDSQEAARWLRVAATQLGPAKTAPDANSQARTSSSVASPSQSDEPVTGAGAPPIIDVQNYSRVQRAFAVRASALQLQELPQPWRLQRATP